MTKYITIEVNENTTLEELNRLFESKKSERYGVITESFKNRIKILGSGENIHGIQVNSGTDERFLDVSLNKRDVIKLIKYLQACIE